MGNSCELHPLTPARWQCRTCFSLFCQKCTPEDHPKCPECLNHLESLGSSNEIVPFWDRLPEFFKYPLKGSSLLLVLAATFIMTFIQPSLSGGLIAMSVFAFQSLYSFSVLKHTAKGELAPPALLSVFDGNFIILLKSVIWFAGLIFLGLSGFLLSNGFGLFTIAVVCFFYPASAIIYIYEKSVPSAINPLRLIDFFLRTRSGYVVLFIHLALIMMASGAAEQWVASQEWRPQVYMAFTGFFSAYFSIMIFSLCGYFLLQYQRELNIISSVRLNDDYLEEDLLYRVKYWVKKGNYENAFSALTALRSERPNDSGIKNYQWDLYLQTKQYKKLSTSPDLMITRYISVGRFSEIKPFIYYLLKYEASAINSLTVRMQLAKTLQKKHLNLWAFKVLQNIAKSFNDDPGLVKALLLLSDIALEINKEETSKKVLNYAHSIANDEERDIIEKRMRIIA